MCQGGQLENLGRRLLRGVNWKGFQSRQKSANLVEGDSLTAVGHKEAIPNFVEPEDGNQGTLLGQAGEDAEAVFPVCFVFKELLERKGSVQHQIAHRRWPS